MILRIVFEMQEQLRPYTVDKPLPYRDPTDEPKADRRLNILWLDSSKVNGEFH